MVTQKRVRELFDYRSDGALIRKVRVAQRVRVGDAPGCKTPYGYLITVVDGEHIFNHRIVWLWHKGYIPEHNIDHINGIKTDNRIENLREASPSCNNLNSGKRVDNKSGVRGVSWSRKDNRWVAILWRNKKRGVFGYYKEFSEAALARLTAEICLEIKGMLTKSSAYKYAVKNNLIKKEFIHD